MTPEDAKLIGASDAAALLGLDPNRTAFDVFNRIVCGIETPDTPILRRGRRYEPVLRVIAQEDFGLNLLGPVSVRDPKRPHLRGTLDDKHQPMSPCSLADLEPVELKSVSPFAADDLGESGTDHVKEAWVVQCNLYMHLTGAPRCHVVAGIGLDDNRHFILKADLELQGIALEAVDKFHRDHILTQRPPRLDGSSGCSEWLAHRFPKHDRTVLPAGPDAEEWARRYRHAREQREKLEALEAEARNQLIALVGESHGLEGGVWRLTYGTTKGRTKTNWEAVAKEAGVPEALVAKHTTTGASYRRFLLKEKKQ